MLQTLTQYDSGNLYNLISSPGNNVIRVDQSSDPVDVGGYTSSSRIDTTDAEGKDIPGVQTTSSVTISSADQTGSIVALATEVKVASALVSGNNLYISNGQVEKPVAGNVDPGQMTTNGTSYTAFQRIRYDLQSSARQQYGSGPLPGLNFWVPPTVFVPLDLNNIMERFRLFDDAIRNLPKNDPAGMLGTGRPPLPECGGLGVVCPD